MIVNRKSKTPPESCPVCGADVPRNARACPGCGADHETGWSEESYASGLGLPEDDDFNYDDFVRKEFGDKKEIKPRGLHWVWWIVGIGLALGLLYWNLPKFF